MVRFRNLLLALSFVLTGVLSGLAGPTPALAAGAPSAGFAASDFATGFATTNPTNGIGPIGVAFDASDHLYVMDDPSSLLYKFGPAGGAASAATQVNTTPIAGRPTGIAFDKSGNLYAALQAASEVVQLDPTTGAVLRTVASVPCATGLATDPLSGDLFATTIGCVGGLVDRISNFQGGPGTVTTYASLGDVDGITFGPDGTLYVARGGNSVWKVAGTNAPQPAAASAVASVPTADGTAVAASNDPTKPPFIFVNQNNGSITKVDLTQSPPALSPVVTGGTRGDFVTVGPDGCLYATQSATVEKVTNADGSCSLAPVGLSISLAPATQSHGVGDTATLTATLNNDTNPGGTPVTFTVTGPNGPQTHVVPANASGTATFTYGGATAGTDTVVATATVHGVPLTSNSATVVWVQPQTLRYYLHVTDIPRTDGNFTMNLTPPPPALFLGVNLLGAVPWDSDPPISGTFGSSSQFTLVAPCVLGLTVAPTYTLSVVNADGSGAHVVGQTSGLLGLCLFQAQVPIPVTTPLTMNNQRLRLSIATLVSLHLQLGPDTYLQATDFVPASGH